MRPQAWGNDTAICVVAFCVVFAAILFQPRVLNDSDTLWQIRTGEWMLAHHAIPTTDPFSFTAGDRPWFAHEWLSELLMGLAFVAGGMRAVMALAAGAAALTAAVLLHHLRRFLPGIYAVAGVVLGLGNAAPSLLARPHVMAWPCLAVWCGGIVAARARGTAPSFVLLAAMLLWVNLHGSFVVGLVLAAALMIEALFDPRASRRQVLLTWGPFLLAACAVTLLNPDGLGGALFPFRQVGMTSLAWVQEWQPASFATFQPLELTILGALALGLSGKVRLPPVRLLIFLGLVHAALAHSRHGQLLGMIGALILAEPLAACLPARSGSDLPVPRRTVMTGTALLAAAALAARFVLPLSPERTGAAMAALLDRVPAELRAKPVLNDYSLGGNLIFAGVRPFIDGRADLYGDAFLERYSRITAPSQAELERAISDYGVAWTIFPANRPIVALLDHEPGWQRLVSADGLVVHAAVDQLAR